MLPVVSHCCWFCATFVLAATGIFSHLCLGCEFTLIPGNPPGVIPNYGIARQELGKQTANLAQLFPPRALPCLFYLASLLTYKFLETGPVFCVTWLLGTFPKVPIQAGFSSVFRDAGGELLPIVLCEAGVTC